MSLDKAKMPRTTGSLHKDDAEIQNTNMIQKMYWQFFLLGEWSILLAEKLTVRHGGL